MTGQLFDAVERARLSDLLDDLGPEAPTLLVPWTTYDLAAHLVQREHDHLAGPGLVLPGAWARFAEQRRKALALKDFARLVTTFRRDRRQASSASDGCAGSPASTSSSSTMRTFAGPTVMAPGPTSGLWTRRFGATSPARRGISRGGCAAQVSNFSGPEPPGPPGRGEENRQPASPDPQASCCSTSSAGRARRMSR